MRELSHSHPFSHTARFPAESSSGSCSLFTLGTPLMAIVIESVLFHLVFIADKTWSLMTGPLIAWTLYLCILQLKYVVQ